MDPKIADSMKFLGRFFVEDQDDHKAALPFFEEALAIFEAESCESIDYLSLLNDVAYTLDGLDRIEEARGYYERAYEASFRAQGERHTETALFAHNLGVFYMEECGVSEAYKAVPLLRLSLKTAEVMQGSECTETADSQRRLAQSLLMSINASLSVGKFVSWKKRLQ
eukprot:SAG11_NODE_1359_length_5116_cov_11.562687_3_plen_167_part_00